MNFDNAVKIAFIISVFFHAFIFFAFPSINIFLPRRPIENFQISYYRLKDARAISAEQKQQAAKTPSPEKLSKMLQAQKEKLLLASQKKKEEIKNVQEKKDAVPPMEEKKDMVIPPLPAGIEKMPAYLDYVQSVREKIKRVANASYQRSGSGGEVLLNFILANNGGLVFVKIMAERSCFDERLRQLAREAIEKASPFDPFPLDLEFKQLSFSVIISFE